MTVTAGRAIQIINSDQIITHLTICWSQWGQIGNKKRGWGGSEQRMKVCSHAAMRSPLPPLDYRPAGTVLLANHPSEKSPLC